MSRSSEGDIPGASRATGYELETAVISRRTSRPAIAASAAIVGMLAVAIGVGLAERDSVATDPRTLGVASARPATVHCHDLAAGPCERIAAAALDVIGPDATVESIDVWQSLLCGDDLDCPPGRLAGLRPLGSAVVGFGDAEPAGWINVGERPAGRGAGGGSEPALVAWLIR